MQYFLAVFVTVKSWNVHNQLPLW